MTVVAWILLVPFGLLGLRFVLALLFGGSISTPSAVFMVISIVIVALCSGYLWGGLDIYFS